METFYPKEMAGRHGEVHVKPLPDQGYDTSLFVSCSRKIRDSTLYPVGTVFKLSVKLTDREGGGEYLYANPRSPIVVVRND